MKSNIVVMKGTYQDSAFLMRVTRELKTEPGVVDAVVLMGTPMNLELVRDAGFDDPALSKVTPMDMVVAVHAEDDDSLVRVAARLETLLSGGSAPVAGGETGGRPDLDEALLRWPDAGVVSIAVPGAYAAYVAHRALEAGRHVFLFSDNVSVVDEVALKQRALASGLMVMGPDCGTAMLGGVNLGFANRVPRGPVGVVGASGTGIQEYTSLLARDGIGITHAIGTGGRDLSEAVGGVMTEFGLRVLASDPQTRILALIAKHPSEAVASRMHAVLKGLGKPVVVRYLGTTSTHVQDGVTYAGTLDEAVTATLRQVGSGVVTSQPTVADEAARIATLPRRRADRIVGLFVGGSLASEAKLILEMAGVAAATPNRPLKATVPLEVPGHLVIDTGDDFYTVGKPHPMVDQTIRCELMAAAGRDPSVGIVLFDVVLGDGSHPDPGPEIVTCVRAVLDAGGLPPLFVASITGTVADPQNLERQRTLLEQAGVLVLPSAAMAAQVAARIMIMDAGVKQ